MNVNEGQHGAANGGGYSHSQHSQLETYQPGSRLVGNSDCEAGLLQHTISNSTNSDYYQQQQQQQHNLKTSTTLEKNDRGDALYLEDPERENDEMEVTERELAEDAQWKRIQQNTFTRWANEHLKTVEKNIGSLETDLSDGLRLITLIEVLSGKRLPKHNKRPTFRSLTCQLSVIIIVSTIP